MVLLGGNLATALYSDMKVPHDISRVLLRSQSLEFIEIISSLSSELNLWFLNQMSGMTESDNKKVHSNNARTRRAQFAAKSSRAIYWDKQSIKLGKPTKSSNIVLQAKSWMKIFELKEDRRNDQTYLSTR